MKIAVEVKDDTIESLVVSALEGGSNYWYRIVSPESLPSGYESEIVTGALDLRIETLDREAINGATSWLLNPTTIQNALRLLGSKYPRMLADILSENDDATTADVFLQCALFGEVVFG